MSVQDKLFQNIRLSVKVNGLQIPQERILKISVKSSIDEILPYGVLVINDLDGVYLRSLTGIAIGTPIEITASNTEANIGSTVSETYSHFVVASFSSNIENSKVLSGAIQIFFCHNWYLQRSCQPTPYVEMTNTAVLEEILSQHGIELSDDWITTDEAAAKRFRFVDDIEFSEWIVGRSTSNGSPVYFWVDLYNTAHLSSMPTMLSKECLTVAFDSKISFADEIENLLKSINIDGGSSQIDDFDSVALCSINKVSVFGDSKEEALKLCKVLNRKIYIDLQTEQGSSLSGDFKARLNKGASNSVGLLPMDGNFYNGLSNTDIGIIKNLNINDANSIVRSDTKAFYESCKLNITSSWNTFKPGDPITLAAIANYDQINDGTADSGMIDATWMSGLWAIKSISMESTGGNSAIVAELIRPYVYSNPLSEEEQAYLATIEETT